LSILIKVSPSAFVIDLVCHDGLLINVV